jgi:hypothetical protein
MYNKKIIAISKVKMTDALVDLYPQHKSLISLFLAIIIDSAQLIKDADPSLKNTGLKKVITEDDFRKLLSNYKAETSLNKWNSFKIFFEQLQIQLVLCESITNDESISIVKTQTNKKRKSEIEPTINYAETSESLAIFLKGATTITCAHSSLAQ